MDNTKSQKTNKLNEMQAELDKDVKKKEEDAELLRNAAKDPDLFPEIAQKVADSEKPQYAQIQDVQQSMTDDAQRVKAALASEKKIVFHLPLGPGEKEGAVEYACINGYRFMIKKNVPVEMPESVYLLLANHYNIQTSDPEIGKRYRLDRTDDHLRALV